MKLPGLKQAREKKGLTQNELAQKAGLTAQTISNIENGFETRKGTAERIAKWVGGSVEKLQQEAATA